MYLLLAAYTPHAVTCGVCGVSCFIADCLTGTAFFQKGNNDMWNETLDPTPVELDSIEVPDDDWSDLTGVDVDGFAEDSELLLGVEDAEWLHAMLYSDYADPSDDDDREGMAIPAHVVARYGMGV
jgi:hypothetical protein